MSDNMLAICRHFIHGQPARSSRFEELDVTNPATGETLTRLPIASADDVDRAVASASEAFRSWSATPPVDRARVLFRFKESLERRRRELVELIALDNGKTLAEAQGDVQRGIEAVEFATGVPSHLLGTVAEDVSSGVDCEMFRQPVGVVAGFTPFNFPVMVPLWMVPVAVACGNTFVLKPSERAPLATARLAELFAECGPPPGVFNIVHGAADVAERLMAHPDVRAVSVVGSTPVARHVYSTAATHGKRVQALGGAKNALIVLEDCNLPAAVDSITASAFGCAGQRCLAGSNLLAVGNVAGELVSRLATAAESLRLGQGSEPTTGMGPVIAPHARERVIRYIDGAEEEGARLAIDGRARRVTELPGGYFIGPTIVDDVRPDMTIAREEIFGPVLSVIRVDSLDEAIDTVNAGPFGNSASIYTDNGGAVREFRRRIEAGMLGVNLGVPAPLPFFPFSGWKGSFFGDLHTQGKDGIEFYTRRKVVTSRWP